MNVSLTRTIQNLIPFGPLLRVSFDVVIAATFTLLPAFDFRWIRELETSSRSLGDKNVGECRWRLSIQVKNALQHRRTHESGHGMYMTKVLYLDPSPFRFSPRAEKTRRSSERGMTPFTVCSCPYVHDGRSARSLYGLTKSIKCHGRAACAQTKDYSRKRSGYLTRR